MTGPLARVLALVAMAAILATSLCVFDGGEGTDMCLTLLALVAAAVGLLALAPTGTAPLLAPVYRSLRSGRPTRPPI